MPSQLIQVEVLKSYILLIALYSAITHLYTQMYHYRLVMKKQKRLTIYDGEMTISKAYEYLKTLSQYEGAEDI